MWCLVLTCVTLARMQIFAYNICRGILEDSLLLRQLRESRFDLGIFEMMHSCPAGVMELVGIPKTMLVSAIGMGYHHYRLLGMEKPASFVPATFTIYGSRMTFIGRLHNIAFNALGWMFANICEYSEQSLFDSMFPGFPRLHNLIQDKTDYFLMNTNEFTESTRPTLLSIGHVGGSSISTPRPLSDEFERIVSKGSRGAILFSLGSLVKFSDMPVTVRRAFTEAFQLFPEYVILWKSDAVTNSTYSNIYYHDWIPQAINTVLGTHGESAYTQRVRQAARLLKGSPEEMRRKIKRFARISGSEPPLNHLKLDIGHLNNFQYYNIDIYLFLCVMFSFSIFAFYHSTVLVYRFILPLKKRKCD
ncbi:UDP-glucoronosyl and UDP-glucosyl transferase [Ostertagia ostertagi]